ncbi:MAG: haloalkane dehalogenase [Mycobacteriaceae bacterium]|nr:haloalkane dehalogenase [Mycobacteriaceae bacterium]
MLQPDKKTALINGHRMAYRDIGEGDAIVFAHGNPTSSYLWRNVIPHLQGLGRLVACDMIGMGDSDKLSRSGPDGYGYLEQRDYLFALWDHLELGDNVVLVLHDWGSALGFDWAAKHAERVAGIAYGEAIVAPMRWEDWPERPRQIFQALRSPAGEQMILDHNAFVEQVLPAGMMTTLSDEDLAAYRAPYIEPGESRRPTLSWPRHIPIDGEPAQMVDIVARYSTWLAHFPVPKLFINAEPGAIITGRLRELCRTWPNQTEITVPGGHFIPEDSPDAIGRAVAEFVQRIRGDTPHAEQAAPPSHGAHR